VVPWAVNVATMWLGVVCVTSGTALEMKRMPAVTLRKSMNQRAQNCGVQP
jgi:hypothetical protein